MVTDEVGNTRHKRERRTNYEVKKAMDEVRNVCHIHERERKTHPLWPRMRSGISTTFMKVKDAPSVRWKRATDEERNVYHIHKRERRTRCEVKMATDEVRNARHIHEKKRQTSCEVKVVMYEECLPHSRERKTHHLCGENDHG